MSITASKGTNSSAGVPAQSGANQRSTVTASANALLSSRRVNVPRALFGGMGVVVCSIGAVVTSHVLDPRTAVLVMMKPVAAGQVITAAELGTVPVTVGRGVDVIPTAQLSTVLGRPAAVPLPAGALLGSADADAGGAGDLARGELECRIGFDPKVAAEGEVPAVLLAVDGEGFA